MSILDIAPRLAQIRDVLTTIAGAAVVGPEGPEGPEGPQGIPGDPSDLTGSAFPGSPSAGDIFYHTTHKQWALWTGAEWQGEAVNIGEVLQADGLYSGTAPYTHGYVPSYNAGNFRIVEAFFQINAAAPSDGSNFWSIALTTATGTLIVPAITTATATGGTPYVTRLAVDALSTAPLAIRLTGKNGAPGAIFLAARVVVRPVLT